jgi:hypothetical protein
VSDPFKSYDPRKGGSIKIMDYQANNKRLSHIKNRGKSYETIKTVNVYSTVKLPEGDVRASISKFDISALIYQLFRENQTPN